MRGRGILYPIAVAMIVVAGVTSCNQQSSSTKPNSTEISPVNDQQASTEAVQSDLPSLPRLPETKPPPGLPIVLWGKRDHFPVIHRPKYLTAEQGDRALARNEPVLGLIIGTEVRAYSTNQLNEHEMVIDEIGGTPVLVSY